MQQRTTTRKRQSRRRMKRHKPIKTIMRWRGKRGKKSKCKVNLNPWHDILMKNVLKKNNTTSKSQKEWWCRYTRKLKKMGESCVSAMDTPNNYNLNTWNHVCK